VGIQCRDAAKAYDGQSSVSRVLEVFSRATVVQHSKVTVFDLLVMRFETYMSRISNREGIQA
jgi:hypothetical protein